MRDHSLNRAIGSLLVYLFYLGALTLSPFDFSSASIAERTWVFGNILLADFLINIFGFVPFGAILYTLTRAGSGNVVLKFGITVGLAAILSLSIETGQLFLLPRIPSLTDILTNTFGGGLGFWQFTISAKPHGSFVLNLPYVNLFLPVSLSIWDLL